MLRAAAACAVVIAASFAVARGVHAQDDADAAARDAEARQAFLDGRGAYGDGRYEAALTLFTRAYELSGRADLLYNIGLSHDRLRHDRDALDAYRRYLDTGPSTQVRAEVESRIRVLEAEVAREDELARQLRDAGDDDGGGIATSPIFWTVVGVVVVGAAVGIGLALSQDLGVADPEPGPSGIVIFALQ